MRVVILGFGRQGKSAYEYWRDQGHDVTICDQNVDLEVPAGAKTKLGKDYLQNLSEFNLIVRSPGVHPKQITAANSELILEKVTNVTNEFIKVCPTRNIIGVTGTKGKGTTSTLITKMLETAGYRVHLGGNIGTPPLDLLKNNIGESDWVVLELANFQLIDLKLSPKIGVCLMVEPEHQDWHSDVHEYIESKQQLFRWQTPDDIAIYYAFDSTSCHIARVSPGLKLPYMKHPGADVINGQVAIGGQEICDIKDIKLLGKHNWQNVCAATTAVWQITQNTTAISSVLKTFSGLEHRLEFIREFNGVRYYDDSFGTTPTSAIVAMQAFKEPKVVILGGRSKGIPLDPLADAVLNTNVKGVIAIGETAEEITDLLKKAGFSRVIRGGKNIAEIVAQAQDIADKGDVVLLSTACASFDMFENYKDRGEKFSQAVRELV